MKLKMLLLCSLIIFSTNLFAQIITLGPDMDETAPLVASSPVQVHTFAEMHYCRIIPASNVSYTMFSTSSSDPYAFLYDANQNFLDASDDDIGLDFSITYLLDSGETYYIGIANYDGEANITLTITGDGLLPVELTSFDLFVKGSDVNLTWQTKTERNNYGFEVERANALTNGKNKWTKIGSVAGNGNSNSPKDYTFTDPDLSSGKYSYRLKQLDIDGKFDYSKIITVEVFSSPVDFSLLQNYPNPFNPSTTISYKIPEAALVTLKVYNLLGSEITTLVNEFKQPGNYTQVFNGSNLSTGVYLYSIQAGSFKQTKKMTLMK